MRKLRTCVLMGSLVLGLAADSPAQVSVSIGNPYTGQGISIGSPAYGYSSGYSNYSGFGPGGGYYNNTTAFSGTGYLAGPGVIGGTYGYAPGALGTNPVFSGYNSGYAGVAPTGAYYPGRPYYGGYGYGGYGYGSRDGFPPYRGVNSFRPFRR